MPLSADEREIIRNGREFQDLVNTPAFKLLQQIIQRRINAETTSSIQPEVVRNPDGSLADGMAVTKMEDRQKGAIFGMLLTIGLPQNMINQASELLKREGSKANEEPAQEKANVPKSAP